MKRPIILETEWVRPLDAGAAEIPCITCAQEVGRWMVGKPPNSYLSCARCFLYMSPWGKAHKDRIVELVVDVEENIGRSISDDGVVIPAEADRILSSIVAISGVARARAQRRLREGPGA